VIQWPRRAGPSIDVAEGRFLNTMNDRYVRTPLSQPGRCCAVHAGKRHADCGEREPLAGARALRLPPSERSDRWDPPPSYLLRLLLLSSSFCFHFPSFSFSLTFRSSRLTTPPPPASTAAHGRR
jgi:hypothetical protein